MAITSPYMLLPVPQIGSDYDPQWEAYLIQSLNRIDDHIHDGAGLGRKIPFSNLDLTSGSNPSGLTFGGASVAGFKDALFPVQSVAPIAPATGVGGLYVDASGFLHYVSQTTDIQLTTGTAINYTGSGVSTTLNFTAGGALFYSNSFGGAWPYAFAQPFLGQPIFTAYATQNPTSDSSTKAAFECAGLAIISTSPQMQLLDSSQPGGFTAETEQWGVLTQGLTTGLNTHGLGLKSYGSTLSTFDTALGIVRNSTQGTSSLAGNLNSWTLHVAGDPNRHSADGSYSLSARQITLNVTSAIVNGAYLLAQPINSSHLPIGAANGYGSAFDFRAAGASFTSYTDMTQAHYQARLAAFWADATNKFGSFASYVYANDVADRWVLATKNSGTTSDIAVRFDCATFTVFASNGASLPAISAPSLVTTGGITAGSSISAVGDVTGGSVTAPAYASGAQGNHLYGNLKVVAVGSVAATTGSGTATISGYPTTYSWTSNVCTITVGGPGLAGANIALAQIANSSSTFGFAVIGNGGVVTSSAFLVTTFITTTAPQIQAQPNTFSFVIFGAG